MACLRKLRVLNANGLKFLAAALMVVDHIGMIFFPAQQLWRRIGRLSMPLFAFALSEGCRYTRNKAKHLALVLALAVVCQLVYYFFDNGSLYMCILVTFSLSTVCIYAMQYMKKCFFDGSTKVQQTLAVLLFLGAIIFTALVCNLHTVHENFAIDYGFWGCMTPVFASIFDFHRIPAPEEWKKLDCLPLRVLCLGLGLLGIALDHLPATLPFYALGALAILLLYNGEKGKWKTKYFFYLFYPLHLVLLEGIYLFTFVW